jgi:RsiW-degrading membrane proteinase PrsW (M82 family)
MIEEGAKLIVPLVFYFLGRYRSEAAGIILGVSTAMGFAALETMGYGFTSLLASKDNVGELDEVLLFRGLMSPAGHAAWTGLCAQSSGERGSKRGMRPSTGGWAAPSQQPSSCTPRGTRLLALEAQRLWGP